MNSRMRTRPALLMTVAVTGSLLLAACSGAAGDGNGPDGEDTGAIAAGEPVRGGTLTHAVNTEGLNMDPAWCGTGTLDRCAPVFDTLLRYDYAAEEFVPGIAESFESEDGMTWTLKLQPGVQFSDGTDLDAEAVTYNWDRIQDPANLSQAQATAALMEWAAIDETTVEVVVDEPNWNLPWSMVIGMGMIGSPTAFEELGADFANAPVGAGPFVLERWTRNSEAVFQRNENYYREGLPYLDTFVLKVIPQDDQRLNALRTGEIDINWSLLTKDAATMESEGFHVERIPLVGGTGLMFNHDDPVASDPDLRQAMLHAFDSQQVNDAVYPGDPGTDAFLFPDSPYRIDSAALYPEKDLALAQEFLDSYLSRTGQQSVTVTFSTYAGIPALEQVSQVIQSQMQALDGLVFEINGIDGAALSGEVARGNYQLTMGATLSPHMDALYEFFHSDGSRNIANYVNPDVDEALETSRQSQDPDEVAAAYDTLNTLISKDGPLRTWRYQYGHLYFGDNVQNVVPMGTISGLGLQVDEVWVTQ